MNRFIPTFPFPSHSKTLLRWVDRYTSDNRSGARMPHPKRVQTSASTPFCLRSQYLDPAAGDGLNLFQHDECLPSSSSNFRNFNRQEVSNGRVKSNRTSSTLAITTFSARDLAMPLAISRGVVSHEVASITFPSGRVTLIASLGLAADQLTHKPWLYTLQRARQTIPATPASYSFFRRSNISIRC